MIKMVILVCAIIKWNMDSEKKYSVEWNDLVNSAILYQDSVKGFLSIKNEMVQRDLKQALHDKELEYYALKIVEKLSYEMQIDFVGDLFYVVIYGNISNAYLARQVLVKIKDLPHVKDEIIKYSMQYTLSNGRDDIYVIRDVAMFLYELKYKDFLLKYISENMEVLKETEFIESDDDLFKIKNMIE